LVKALATCLAYACCGEKDRSIWTAVCITGESFFLSPEERSLPLLMKGRRQLVADSKNVLTITKVFCVYTIPKVFRLYEA
jgi:hypothetical protein